MGTEKRERQRANRQLRHEQQVKDDQRRKLTRRIVIGVVAVVGGVAFVLGLGWLVNRGDDDAPTAVTSVPAEATPPSTSPATSPETGVPPTTVPTTTTEPAPTTATTEASDTTEVATTARADADGFAYGDGACPPDAVAEPVRSFDDAPQLCIDPARTYTARFVTDRGDVVVELDPAVAPGTVNNFVTLARYGYYDDTLLFRTNTTIDIIQGGGRSNTDSPGYEIPDEGSGFTYTAGQIAMARTQAPNSAGGQWFFVVTDKGVETLGSAGTYVPFGTVTEGLDVLTTILALAGPDGDTPSEDVLLERVEITES